MPLEATVTQTPHGHFPSLGSILEKREPCAVASFLPFFKLSTGVRVEKRCCYRSFVVNNLHVIAQLKVSGGLTPLSTPKVAAAATRPSIRYPKPYPKKIPCKQARRHHVATLRPSQHRFSEPLLQARHDRHADEGATADTGQTSASMCPHSWVSQA